MGGGPIIIIDPDKKLQLIAEWRQSWKLYTVWLWALVLALPDLYSGIVAMGWLDSAGVPEALKWGLRGLGVIGIAARLVNQAKPKVAPE